MEEEIRSKVRVLRGTREEVAVGIGIWSRRRIHEAGSENKREIRREWEGQFSSQNSDSIELDCPTANAPSFFCVCVSCAFSLHKNDY